MVLRQRRRRLKEPVTHRKGQGSHSNGEYNKYCLLSVRYDAYRPQAAWWLFALGSCLMQNATSLKCNFSPCSQLLKKVHISVTVYYIPLLTPLFLLVKSNIYHALAMLPASGNYIMHCGVSWQWSCECSFTQWIITYTARQTTVRHSLHGNSPI